LLEKELTTALDAVVYACRLTDDVQRSLSSSDVLSKTDNSPVTVADFGSQAVIGSHIRTKLPLDVIVGEEDDQTIVRERAMMGRVLEYTSRYSAVETEDDLIRNLSVSAEDPEDSDRYWIVDPIDGTRGFLRGDHYAIALALIEQGSVVLAVLGCPTLSSGPWGKNGPRGRIFHAIREQGSFVRRLSDSDTRPINVDSITAGRKAILCESVESAHVSHSFHDRVSARIGISAEPYRIDSQCKYAAVAGGDASIYLRRSSSRGYREKAWDHAAGSLLVSEAGGKVSDFQGEPLDFSRGTELPDRNGIVATNGTLHDSVISAIQGALSQSK
jgi:HAL2 family 3'(2'),5'-bisphosphate nucleotidase